MHILFLTDNFPPESNAPATRTYEHCREWVNAGEEVTVITCAPNFPRGKVYEGYKNRLWQQEDMEGIRVIRVWSYIAPNAGFSKRIIDYISFGVSSFLASLFVRADLIVATSPQFFTAVSGYAASWITRRRWVMEVRDLWPESIRAVGAAKGKDKLLDYLEKLELFLYRKASKIVVVTDAFRKNLVMRGIDDSKIKVITNGVYPELFAELPKDEELLKNLQLEDKFVVGYLGTHGMAHKLDFILDCVKDAPRKVHFLFVGGGARKADLLDRVQRERFSNVTMLPPVPKSEITRYLSLTDVALVPLKRSDTFKTVIPSKIFENAAMKKPILLGVQGESQAIIEKYGAGLCFIPEDKQDFLEKLLALSTNTDLYNTCQEACTRLAQDYNRGRLALQMLDDLQKLQKEK